MVETVRAYGSPKNVGILALVTRIKLADSVTIPSLLYNIECVPKFSKEEMKNLESMQREILARILDVPNSTPYMGILMETGIWTMEARLAYKKLMLYHNILHSDEERIIKKILQIQKEEERSGTWNDGVQKMVCYYGIEKDVNEVLKSE